MRWYERLHRALQSPILFLRGFNRLYYQRFHSHEGIDIFLEDWDNLLILDGCRFDVFLEQNDLPGRLESRQSAGSATFEFLKANFADRDLLDTVYITANPQLYRHRNEIVYKLHGVINIWQDKGWDSIEGTVLPETVTEFALSAAKEYPSKRLIIHYMQPHYPFIGSNTEFDKHHLEVDEGRGENVWGQVMTGQLDIERDQLWELYARNLDRALPHIREAMESLQGKTVVTADHGNFVGDRRESNPHP